MFTASASTPVFNHSLLLVNLGGDLELAAELAELYQIEGLQLLKQLRRVIADRDLPATSRLTHSFKGASANMAASQLYQCCQQLEQAAHEGNWNKVVDDWQSLPELFYTFSNHVADIFSLPSLPISLSAFVAEYSL